MYSPRRGSYKYRSRQYYKKKRINRKFSPALYKSPIPDYFQQKGRIIQTSPARIPIVPRYLPNGETLDKMYNTLIQANYPGVIPSAQYNGYYFTYYQTNIKDIFTFSSPTVVTSDVIDSKWLNDYVTNYVQRPPLPEGYEIHADIFALNFDFTQGTDESLYSLIWHSPIKSSDTTLISKAQSSTLAYDYNNMFVLLSPRSTNQIFYNQISFSSASISQSISSGYTDQNISTDNQYYPFVTSDDPALTSYLRVIRQSGSADPTGTICFLIVYRYIESL